jgi:hypothetical protein
MRRTILATTAAVALLATTASAAVAFADNGKAYGKGVQFHCGAPYGQLVKLAPAGHPVTGAKYFMEEVAQGHPGCVGNPLP